MVEVTREVDTLTISELYTLGESSRKSFKYEAARSFYLQARKILDTLEPEEKAKLVDLEGKVLNALGVVVGQLGEYDSAINNLEEALQLRQTSGDYPLETAYIFNNLGMVAEYQEEQGKARGYYQQAYDILKALDNNDNKRRAKAVVINNLSLAKTALGEYSEIPSLLKESLEDFNALNDQQGVGQTLHNMGYTEYAALGNNDNASTTNKDALTPDKFKSIEGHYIKALKIRRKIDDKLGEARTLNSLGCLYGEYVAKIRKDKHRLLKQADVYLESAQRLFGELQDPLGQELVESSFKIVETARRQLKVRGWLEKLIDVITDIG